jgi:hypothetical protein
LLEIQVGGKSLAARSTEIMVRNFLMEELQKRKLKTSEHPQYSTPRGRMEPDLLLQNGGDYVVETKLGGDLFTAFKELYDYVKYIKVSGGFAIILPEQLRTSVPVDWLRKMATSPQLEYIVAGLFSDARPITQVEGGLGEIADWIADQVLRPPAKIEIDTSLAIRVLRSAVSYISFSTRKLGTTELEDIFGGKSVFENILQYEEKKYPLKEMQEAASYLLINQIMFYHVLSSTDPIKFEPMDEDALTHPAHLNRYFEKVLRVNYTPVFGFDIASRLPDEVVPTLKNVIEVTKALGPEKIGYDILGKIFHDLIPFEIRKAVAAFYTNNEAAELLAHLAIDSPEAKVADMAVGSGTLLVSSYKRKRSLLPSFGVEDHRRFLTRDLTGIDIMPFAAHLAVVHLSLQSPQFKTDKVRVAVWDSTELKPERVIPTIAKELKIAYKRPTLEMFMEGELELGEEAYVKKGAIAFELGRDEIPLEKVDVTIMNPPFTRQERIPKEYKEQLGQRFRIYEDYLHGQLGFYGYFIFLADMFLEEGGRMAFVLPATVLRIKSCRGVREFLAKNYHVEHIITTHHRSAFSESVRFREILLVAKKIGGSDPSTKISVLKKLPKSPDEAVSMADSIRTTTSAWEDDRLVVRVKDYDELRKSTENWFKYIAVEDTALLDLLDNLLSSDKLTNFSTIAKASECDLRHYKYENFHGFIIFDESRAKKKIDRWILETSRKDALVARDRISENKVNVPLVCVGRGLRRLSYVRKMDITKISDFLILCWFDDIKELARPLLRDKQLEKFNKSAIKLWKNKFDKTKSYLILSRRVDLSAPGTSAIAFYSDNPAVGIDLWGIQNVQKDYAKILALWLNSTLNLLQILILRTETRGAWIKIHDYMLRKELKKPRRELRKAKSHA